MKNLRTIEDATRKWVDEFNCINSSLIERIMESEEHSNDFNEVTTPVVGDYADVSSYHGYDSYEIISIDYECRVATILDGEEQVDVDLDDIYIERDSILPMWGWLWSFGNGIDEGWARENLGLMSECGFRIYEDDYDGTLYFGIDGAGYSFLEAHFIPLYKARGLKWHDEENLNEAI